MSRLRIRTPPPAALFRFFRERTHAERFCGGELRFGSYDYYANAPEPERRDEEEGKAEVLHPGRGSVGRRGDGVEQTTVIDTSPAYLLCLTSADTAAHTDMARRWGPLRVTIAEPEAVFAIIADGFRAFPGAVGPLECGAVFYEDVVPTGTEPPSEEARAAARFSKRLMFAPECEYRVVKTIDIRDGPRPDFITLRTPGVSRHCVLHDLRAR